MLGHLCSEDLRRWREIVHDLDGARMSVNDLTLEAAQAMSEAETGFLAYVHEEYDIEPEERITISAVTGVIFANE